MSTSPVSLPKQIKPKSPKKATKSTTETFSSTILTSPLAPRMRRPTNRPREVADEMEDYAYNRDAFAATEYNEGGDHDFAFEPFSKRRTPRIPGDDLGPPILADQILPQLPLIHREFVFQFVDEAKREMEKLRNSKTMKKPIFTETNLRDMAVSWTTTPESMKSITAIDPEAVDRWGSKFIPLVKKYSTFYRGAMNENDGRNLDPNHLVVIDLSSDVESDEGAEESKFFQANASPTGGRTLPWERISRSNSAAPKNPGKRFTFKDGRGRGGRKNSGRRSNRSASGYSSTGVSKTYSSGSSKRGGVGAKTTSAASKQSNLMKSFGNHGGRSSGGTGGIGMMPT